MSFYWGGKRRPAPRRTRVPEIPRGPRIRLAPRMTEAEPREVQVSAQENRDGAELAEAEQQEREVSAGAEANERPVSSPQVPAGQRTPDGSASQSPPKTQDSPSGPCFQNVKRQLLFPSATFKRQKVQAKHVEAIIGWRAKCAEGEDVLWFDESFANLGTQEKVRDTVTGWLQDSRKALVDLHEWLLTTVRPTEKVITFDEFALTIYDVVNSAIQDFLRSDAGQSISDAMQVKLRFFRSDWLRQALIVMRVAQFFSKEDGSRKEANTMEVLVALRRLRRQWQYHNAMYSLAANSPEPGSKHAKETSAQKPWHKGVKTLLTDEQVLQAAVLTETKPEEKFSKTNLRSKFRNYRGSAFKEDKDGNTLYRKLGIALDKLVANGLLLSFEEVQGEDDEKKRQTKNPKKTTMYTKPKASEMTEESQKSRNDLHVTVEAFPA